MFPRFLKLVVLGLTVAVSACGSDRNFKEIDDRAPTAPSAGTLGLGRGAIHSKQGWLHEVGYYVSYNVPESVIEGINNAAKSWNDAIGRNLLTFRGRMDQSRSEIPKSLYTSLDDDDTIFYFDENWSKNTGKSAYTLATTVWENSPYNVNAIVKGDVRFNTQNFKYLDSLKEVPDSTMVLDVVDTESVMLHEIGHLIGLDHVTYDEDPDSVMHAQTPIGYGFAFRKVSAKDAERVQSIYPK